MKITNELNLPASIVEAVKNDSYEPGESDISVTQLIDPPRKVALMGQHYDELIEDASDRLWSMFGQIVHGILERADDQSVTEQRLYMDILGWRVGGQMDRLAIGEGKDTNAIILEDYKFTTAYSVKGGRPRQEWIEQQNCYAQILRENGHKVEAINVVAIFRDWSKLKAKREADYPQKQVAVVKIPMWSAEDTVKYMTERVRLHQEARAGNLPNCTEDERWAKPTTYAIMKTGRKSALRVLYSLAEAEQYARSKGLINDIGKLRPEITIVERPGAQTRCENYCAVAPFCQQFQAVLKSSE